MVLTVSAFPSLTFEDPDILGLELLAAVGLRTTSKERTDGLQHLPSSGGVFTMAPRASAENCSHDGDTDGGKGVRAESQ